MSFAVARVCSFQLSQVLPILGCSPSRKLMHSFMDDRRIYEGAPLGGRVFSPCRLPACSIPNVIQKLGFRLRQSPGVQRSQVAPIFLILGDLRSLNRGSFRVSPNPIFESRSV